MRENPTINILVAQLANSLVATFFGIFDLSPATQEYIYKTIVSIEIIRAGAEWWETVPQEVSYNRKLISLIFQDHKHLIGKKAISPEEKEKIHTIARTLITALCDDYVREKHSIEQD